MKLFKRMFSMVMAIIMMLAVTVAGASAAENPLPDQCKNGSSSITVHKYGVDESYETTYDSVGKVLSGDTVVGTTDEGSVTLGDLTPLENIEFKLERMVENKDGDGNVIIPVTYAVDSTFTAVTKSTGSDGVLTFGGLEFGIYRVTELPSAAVTKISDPSYISVPMSDPENPSEWLYDIHVYPKNEIEGPDIDKSVSYLGNQDDTVDISEQVKWIVTTKIMPDVATSKEYVITDELAEVLRYASSPNALEVSYVNYATSQKTPLTPDTHYTLTYTQGSNAYPWNDSLTVALTAAGRQEIAKSLSATADNEPRLTVEFYTSFDIPDEKVKDYLGTAIENQAKLKYTNSANVTYTPESEIPEVHTGGIRLKKVDPNGSVLGGAEFKIYRSQADALAGTNAVADPTDLSKDWIVTSDATTGLAEFLGLAYGTRATGSVAGDKYNDTNAQTEYWIVEVKAPKDAKGESYNLLKDPVKVVVNATSHDDTNIITVVNSKFSLPLTGGSGTIWFTVAGLFLLGTGVCFFIVSKKSKKQAKQIAG